MSARRASTLVTGPNKEPVTEAEVKAWARIDGNTEDALLTSLITAARVAAEEYLRRSLITQSWRLTLDLPANRWADNLPAGTYDLPITALSGEIPRTIDLPKGPVQSITSVSLYNTSNSASVYDSSYYTIDTAGDRLLFNDTAVLPSNLRDRAACVIEYVAGYGADPTNVPQPIKTAILMHATAMYESRGQCESMDLPGGAKQLLNQYRKLGELRG